ncbi:hypothetical protein [Bacillus sp. FSL K6-3431]|uniref:hypothetical protein n=1 Tax=Bacillus sp. FSL K6-3431 TaxID=2921500 RepID=UPI0030FBDD1A
MVVGDWVTYRGEIGWVEYEGKETGRLGVYLPNRRTKIIFVHSFELRELPTDISDLRDSVMIDLALDTWDKEWFMEVTG